MTRKDTSRRNAMITITALAAGLAATPALSQSLVDKADRDEVALVAKDDPVMARAMQKARETLPDFLSLAASPRPGMEGFAIKFAVREGDAVEYFWIHPFQRKGDQFTCRLDNR